MGGVGGDAAVGVYSPRPPRKRARTKTACSLLLFLSLSLFLSFSLSLSFVVAALTTVQKACSASRRGSVAVQGPTDTRRCRANTSHAHASTAAVHTPIVYD